MSGMSATQELSASYINMVTREVAGAPVGSRFAQAQGAELEILKARRDVVQASKGLEASKRTLMTSDARWGNMFLIADSHKIITRYSEELAGAQARLEQAYAGRMPVVR